MKKTTFDQNTGNAGKYPDLNSSLLLQAAFDDYYKALSALSDAEITCRKMLEDNDKRTEVMLYYAASLNLAKKIINSRKNSSICRLIIGMRISIIDIYDLYYELLIDRFVERFDMIMSIYRQDGKILEKAAFSRYIEMTSQVFLKDYYRHLVHMKNSSSDGIRKGGSLSLSESMSKNNGRPPPAVPLKKLS